jgi:hypothetical protein
LKISLKGRNESKAPLGPVLELGLILYSYKCSIASSASHGSYEVMCVSCVTSALIPRELVLVGCMWDTVCFMCHMCLSIPKGLVLLGCMWDTVCFMCHMCFSTRRTGAVGLRVGYCVFHVSHGP